MRGIAGRGADGSEGHAALHGSVRGTDNVGVCQTGQRSDEKLLGRNFGDDLTGRLGVGDDLGLEALAVGVGHEADLLGVAVGRRFRFVVDGALGVGQNGGHGRFQSISRDHTGARHDCQGIAESGRLGCGCCGCQAKRGQGNHKEDCVEFLAHDVSPLLLVVQELFFL